VVWVLVFGFEKKSLFLAKNFEKQNLKKISQNCLRLSAAAFCSKFEQNLVTKTQ
jgi:hypothetical protein